MLSSSGMQTQEDENICKIATFTADLSRGRITKQVRCDIPIPLPSYSDTREYMSHIIASHNLHPMFHEELIKRLDDFVRSEEEEWELERDEAVIDKIFNEGARINVEAWMEALGLKNTDTLENAVRIAESVEFVMKECSSDKVRGLVEREAEMAHEVSSLMSIRDDEVSKLSEKKEGGRLLETGEKSRGIRGSHDDPTSVYEAYAAELRMMRDRQRREYRDMLRRLREDSSYVPRPLSYSNSSYSNPSKELAEEERGRMEESFTIYLGAQLKTMHNARIVVGEEWSRHGQWDSIHSRLQGSMELYRRNLQATVILVSRDPMYHIEQRTQLARLCEMSTELHFDSLEEQLERIKETTVGANESRKGKEGRSRKGDSRLSLGDVYCTIHSNIGCVHVVFHLVVEDSNETTEMNSRHPYLNGLRNIIRMSSRFGVKTLSLPLLLTSSLNEGSTLQWCSRRAELVFKCVKGYLMEICSTGWSSVSLGGASLSRAPQYNINFTLPSSISPDIYSHIISLFPSVFHLVPSVTA